MATAPISDRELYLAVPYKAILHAHKVYDVPILGDTIKKLNEMYNTEDQFHQLLFLLIHEKAKADSFWKVYIDSLPKTFNNPVYWSKEELQELQGSSIKAEAEQEYQQLSGKFSGIKQRVFEKFPNAFPPNAFTRDNYLWAHSILDSRAIWMDGQRNLVPMLDMVNCGEGPDPTRVHRSNHNHQVDTAETRASWGFKTGEQVLENYGQPNSIYFKYHGFWVPKNTHNCVNIEVPGAHSVCVGGKKGLDGLPEMRGSMDEAMTFVKDKLAGYPTTIREDFALLSKSRSGRHKMAIEYRIDEKVLLEELVQKRKDSAWRGLPDESWEPSDHKGLKRADREL